MDIRDKQNLSVRGDPVNGPVPRPGACCWGFMMWTHPDWHQSSTRASAMPRLVDRSMVAPADCFGKSRGSDGGGEVSLAALSKQPCWGGPPRWF